MFLKKIGKASNKSKITLIYFNNVLVEMYNVLICKIYTSLYGIKLSIKILKVFCYKQSRICRNDITEAKYLPFSQVETLLTGVFKE